MTLVASFSYDAVGRETSRTYGNGLNTTSGYNRADNLITSITVANKPELSFGYSYDSNKNVTAEQRGGSMALYSWNATFDAMDRLNSQNDGAQTRSWSLDLVGNTTSETLNGTAEARTLNAMHAPTAAGNKAYSYDSNGQMTAKPGYTLVWDARNHLVRSTDTSNPSAPTDCAYRYDAFGNRVSKGSTRYLLVDNQVVAEFTGAASKQYCYGSYIDEVLAEKGSAVAYYHRNRQYNTSALTDASGAIVEQYSTDAMGRVKAFDAAASAKVAPTATTVLFTGRVFDAETGLYYFRARYFDPELGVFVSRDPLGFVDGQSVYQGWFELKFKQDPLGLCFRKDCCSFPNVKAEIEMTTSTTAAYNVGKTPAIDLTISFQDINETKKNAYIKAPKGCCDAFNVYQITKVSYDIPVLQAALGHDWARDTGVSSGSPGYPYYSTNSVMSDTPGFNGLFGKGVMNFEAETCLLCTGKGPFLNSKGLFQSTATRVLGCVTWSAVIDRSASTYQMSVDGAAVETTTPSKPSITTKTKVIGVKSASSTIQALMKKDGLLYDECY